MKTNPLQDFLRRLCRTSAAAEGGHLTDAQLLQRFAAHRDEAAFEVLVWRYGGLVLNVAQRMVRSPADAEDVFQATFLTLARKAAAIRRGTAVGSWLYKVVYRIALRMRQIAARRKESSLGGMDPIAPVKSDDMELRTVIAEEVGRLPERYRSAVVLCYLQGSTTEEAARILGCPRGTILSRLAWARQRLRGRLMRRGLAPAIALAAVSFEEAAAITPPAALVASVIRAALPFAASRAALSTVSPQVAVLARGALQTMLWNKIKIAVIVLCAISLTGTGAGWLMRGHAGVETSPQGAEQAAKKPKPNAAKPEREPDNRACIENLLEMLSAEEQKGEDLRGEERIKARQRLAIARDELRLREREWDAEREEKQVELKAIRGRISGLSKRLRLIDDKTEFGKNERGKVEKSLEEATDERDRAREYFEKRKEYETNVLRSLRLEVFRAEEELHRNETRQARQREIFAVKRQALLARLQRVEEAPGRPEAADRLRDVEHKLDALRRDVGELRRDLERQKNP